ncbi:MAG: ribosomal protein [Frankiales bacterium]|nr:ribosomal protein [Frankiales bacterium]
MAVPKRKMSRSNTRSRRSQWKTTLPVLTTCDRGHTTRPHTVCAECGRYDGRTVLTV